MNVELFGIARARAGVRRVEVEASSLGEALVALGAACPGLVPDVLEDGQLQESFLASHNGTRFLRDPGTPLGRGDTLLILGSQAGG